MSATATLVASATSTIASIVTVTVTAPTPPASYYDTWTAAMSTIGGFGALASIIVMAIVGFNLFVLVALASSVGAAVAYGIAWIEWYRDISTSSEVVISAVADIFWLIQEASLSFYSFLIVRKIVRGKERIVYLIVFWFLTFSTVACRTAIMILRIIVALHKAKHNVDRDAYSIRLNHGIDYMHVAYFTSIAACESWNAYFLLKKFYKAQVRCRTLAPLKKSFYTHLLRSSEIRLATLCTIGITRALTWAIPGGPTPGQIGDFVATIEALFPLIFLIDILASKLAFEQRDRLEGSTAQTDWTPNGGNNSDDTDTEDNRVGGLDRRRSSYYPKLAGFATYEPKVGEHDQEAIITVGIKPEPVATMTVVSNKSRELAGGS